MKMLSVCVFSLFAGFVSVCNAEIGVELKPDMPQAFSNTGTIGTKNAKVKVLNNGDFAVKLILRNGPAGFEYKIDPKHDVIQVIQITDIRQAFNSFSMDLVCLSVATNPMQPNYRIGCSAVAVIEEIID